MFQANKDFLLLSRQVADFGIAEMMETMATRMSAAGAGAAAGGGGAAGTLAWKAPETFSDRASDACLKPRVWTMGISSDLRVSCRQDTLRPATSSR